MSSACFVVLEGLDGVGKTTQAHLLAAGALLVVRCGAQQFQARQLHRAGLAALQLPASGVVMFEREVWLSLRQCTQPGCDVQLGAQPWERNRSRFERQS